MLSASFAKTIAMDLLAAPPQLFLDVPAGVLNGIPYIDSRQAAFYYALSSACLIGLVIATVNHLMNTPDKWPSHTPQELNVLKGTVLAGSAIARRGAPDHESSDGVVEPGEMIPAEKKEFASNGFKQECKSEREPLLEKKASVSYGTEQARSTDVEPMFHEGSIYTDEQRADS
ncbi:hypothetical protein LTR17_027073 [Elasticomyces elasticus]|nr:hypothetical protein LTR17_027073 [Elasticomyces elasticus]